VCAKGLRASTWRTSTTHSLPHPPHHFAAFTTYLHGCMANIACCSSYCPGATGIFTVLRLYIWTCVTIVSGGLANANSQTTAWRDIHRLRPPSRAGRPHALYRRCYNLPHPFTELRRDGNASCDAVADGTLPGRGFCSYLPPHTPADSTG